MMSSSSDSSSSSAAHASVIHLAISVCQPCLYSKQAIGLARIHPHDPGHLEDQNTEGQQEVCSLTCGPAVCLAFSPA
jgi:hypothetical protein